MPRVVRASIPASHGWHLPPLHSTSESSLHRPRAKLQPRNIGLSMGDMGLMPPSFGAVSGSAVVDIELRLRERLLQETARTGAAWPPTSSRVQVLFDALREMAQIPSALAPVLPVLIAELTNATMSGNCMRDSLAFLTADTPRPYYFEIVRQLRDELAVQTQEKDKAQEELSISQAIQAEQVALADQLREKISEQEEAIEAMKQREVELEALLAKAQKESALLGEQNESLEKRLERAEEKIRETIEASKETQVTLYVEQRRVVEQQQLYKELRTAKVEAAAAAAKELRMCQRALLRAHQANLKGSGMRAVLHGLTELPVGEQLSHAMKWAEEQQPTRYEDALMRGEAAAIPSAPPEPPSPAPVPAPTPKLKRGSRSRGELAEIPAQA